MNNHKDKIFDFYSAHKRMPSYTEIMRLVGFKSKNAVYKLVNRLIEEGAVLKDATGRLIPSRLFGEVPLLGLVEAGFPSVAEETPLDSLSLDEYLIEKKEKTYLLEASEKATMCSPSAARRRDRAISSLPTSMTAGP